MLFFVLFISNCSKDEAEKMPSGTCSYTPYHYVRGVKKNLEKLASDYIVLGVDPAYRDLPNGDPQIRSFISSVKDFDPGYKYQISLSHSVVLKFRKPKSCEEITELVSTLWKNPVVKYAHYAIQTDDCIDYSTGMPFANRCVRGYENVFFVKIFDAQKRDDLYKMIAETKTELGNQAGITPSTTVFGLICNKNSKGDALRMSSIFHESKLFEWVDMYVDNRYSTE